MRLVKGRSNKNIAMAELFNKEHGDVFFDYGKGVRQTQGMIYMEDKFLMVDKMDSIKEFVQGLSEYLKDELDNREESFKLFVDGNFTENEASALKEIEQRHKVDLTVSVQTEQDGISLQDI
jgi:hypothetical protein